MPLHQKQWRRLDQTHKTTCAPIALNCPNCKRAGVMIHLPCPSGYTERCEQKQFMSGNKRSVLLTSAVAVSACLRRFHASDRSRWRADSSGPLPLGDMEGGTLRTCGEQDKTITTSRHFSPYWPSAHNKDIATSITQMLRCVSVYQRGEDAAGSCRMLTECFVDLCGMCCTVRQDQPQLFLQIARCS